MDTLTKEKRSWNMARIRSKDTYPEKRVRSYLHKSGYRFRLHVKKLPGSPDIVLPQYRTAIFVHGCFWHRHPRCKYAYKPKSRIEFWEEKFKKNIERDREKIKKLKSIGWHVLTIWECETKNKIAIESLINEFKILKKHEEMEQ